ncbi:MAG: GTPase Era [Candidatus Magasanikbacteria bacterium CG10_big_fil_rev_8_21_14_0_10_36_32]|uniref:GTPase Era n=1 Tax=Candidatus Magasanikbacteria bacterium CG10_big_fil_rev_8_21_14_0_10_36_32 TaxID=1974646 RepID=A0A2M6W645_9BACT|nr:MAG: GTPase Era [Candidatus Magasanikbacteria bacterium CG10_big_fil_rev_8_21_14_0_10_36_32]
MTTKNNNQPDYQKSGIITLVGRSNVGKSTLLNTLIGTKVAIVTDKPQTTRNIIHGVLNTPQGQAVFVDTPGIFKQSNLLAGRLTKRVQEAIKDIDVIIYVVDPSKSIGAEERYNLSLIRQLTVPKIMAINKSDLPMNEKLYVQDYRELGDNFSAVFELSALNNSHVQPLRDKVFELLPEGPALYPPEQMTNIDPKFWIAEIIREKIFLALRKEVPYTTHVVVTGIEEKDAKTKNDSGLLIIKATIYTNEPRYKKMIIGANGRAIKEIGIAARKELETALNKKVFLELEVETDKHWENKI